MSNIKDILTIMPLWWHLIMAGSILYAAYNVAIGDWTSLALQVFGFCVGYIWSRI